MSVKNNALLQAAFTLMAHGLSVMPVGRDKAPLMAWKDLQTKKATEDDIIRWWDKWPEANVGIITGKISGITVVDIDNVSGVKVPLDTFPPTYIVKTPTGGFHLYYAYADNIITSANQFAHLPHVDIRNDGGFVVAPPSVCEYVKGNKNIKGAYQIINDCAYAPFPTPLFFPGGGAPKRSRRRMKDVIEVGEGSRNESIASFIGKMIRNAPEHEWGTDVWDAVKSVNKTYKPPLENQELKNTFRSITAKEHDRRESMVKSPIQIEDDKRSLAALRKSVTGAPYKDLVNACIALETHPYFKGMIRYNDFKNQIEYKGEPLDDAMITHIQYMIQRDAHLPSIAKEVVQSAIVKVAYDHRYDECRDWMSALSWDKVPRLNKWLHKATHVEDNAYHEAVGTNWFLAMVQRTMEPGFTFDYALVLFGAQGIGKTSLFRILGGPWYKEYTSSLDDKDFFLALRGALIMDFDEGSAITKSDTQKLKSTISKTHDEFREPYGRVMRRYPRRCVFSMSANNPDLFQDTTGNRRFWPVDVKEKVDFKWLEDNREQLFAEAYDHYLNKRELPAFDFIESERQQERHVAEDSWTDLVMKKLYEKPAYCEGAEYFSITIAEIFKEMFPDDTLLRADKRQEMRLAAIFRKNAGLEKKQATIHGDRSMRWFLTKKRSEELKERKRKPDNDFEI